jgi:hypothetical protein
MACWTAPLQTRADRGQEIRFSDRFRRVIIRAEVHTGPNVGLLTSGSQEDEWDADRFWVGTERRYDAVSIQFRHHHIAEDQVRLFLFRQLDAESTILGG